jgi:hypothetical protein
MRKVLIIKNKRPKQHLINFLKPYFVSYISYIPTFNKIVLIIKNLQNCNRRKRPFFCRTM